MDDTSCVVAEVVEWTEAHSEIWAQRARARQWEKLVTCGGVGFALAAPSSLSLVNIISVWTQSISSNLDGC